MLILDGSTAGEPILELACHGLQQRIQLEVTGVPGAYRQEGTEERLGIPNDYSPCTPTTRVEMVTIEASIAWASNTPPSRSGPSPV